MRALHQFATITAEFRPARTDDLRPGVAACVGVVAEWEALWAIEDGPYAGRWAMAPRTPCATGWPFAWAPDCDLRPVGAG